MEKIKQLLTKSGITEGAAKKICESLEAHANRVKLQFEEEFKVRIAKAKDLCIKETQEHKRELSRRVQIFLETKSTAIQEHLTRLAAERDTEAVAKLEKIAAVTEGVELDGQSNSELQANLAESKRVCQHLLGQRNIAIKKANRVQGIAEKVMKRNRILESKMGTNPSKAITEGNGKKGRLDNKRQGGKGRTTRRTLKENVDRIPPARAAGPDRQINGTTEPRTPDEIAATLGEI